jgi:hypothetical protein
MIIKYDTNDDPAVPALFINGMILSTMFRHKSRDESCLSDEREKNIMLKNEVVDSFKNNHRLKTIAKRARPKENEYRSCLI